jgi:hypothetical protein
MPNTLRIFDAHTGAFLSEQAVAHSGETFPVEVIDEAALARLGPTQDSLTPTFFRGTASIPKDLEPAAESYRSDFRRALHSRHLEFYTSQAGPWMTWVGLVP